MNPALTQTVQIQIAECDINGRWRPAVAQGKLLDIGEVNATSYGLSYKDMMKRGMCWVLYRQHLRFLQTANVFGLPKALDKMNVTTWPGTVEGPIFPRYFIIEKEDGIRIGEAVTSWVLINVETRRPLRPSVLEGQMPQCDELTQPMALPGMLRIVNAKCVEERTVRYSDIDINGHMNNAKYLDWVCDILPLDKMRTQSICEWQVNYISEALPGERLALYLLEEKTHAYVQGKKMSDGRMAFEAKVVYGNTFP